MNFIRKCLFALLLTLPLASCWEAAETCPSCETDQHSAEPQIIIDVVPKDVDTAQDEQLNSATRCPDPISEEDGWSPQEVWAWNERLCLGLEADMSELDPVSAPENKQQDGSNQAEIADIRNSDKCNMEKYEYWPANRRLNIFFILEALNTLSERSSVKNMKI